jgi:hypothetical protein
MATTPITARKRWQSRSATPRTLPSCSTRMPPAFGFTNGIINLTLSANRTWLGSDGGVVNDQVVIGYAEIFWQPSACDRRSTMRCSWRHQRRKVRRINCHIHRRPLPFRHFARLSLGKGAA